MAKMALGTILKVLLYLVLLLPAVIFVNQTINQYSSGATTYSEKQEPITLSDLPTIALCFDFGNTSLIYGVNVSITATLIERQNGTVILLENRNVSTVLGVEMHLSRFQLLRIKTKATLSKVLKFLFAQLIFLCILQKEY